MKDKYLIGLANLVNGAMLGYEDKRSIEQYKKWITDYVKSLESKDVVIRQNENCVVRYPVTDRVSADEEYHLVCQKNYLSTKYIEHLEQQCKKQKEAIDKAIQLLEDDNICADIRRMKPKLNENKYGVEYELLDILKEVSK